MSSYVVEDSIQFQDVSRNLNPYSPLLISFGKWSPVLVQSLLLWETYIKSLSPTPMLVSQLPFNLTALGFYS